MKNDSFIRTGKKEFDELIPKVMSFLKEDLLEVDIDGEYIRGYRSPDTPSIWIRDYSDMLRGVRYFEEDIKSTVRHFADTQAANGRIFDYFTTSPEKLPCERENWTKYVRVPVEADVEYRFIKAAFLSWQAHGDDEWIKSLLPNLEKALDYVLNHPQRFDRGKGLVKRPYTIDTWDFAYTAGKHDWLQFQIDDDTYWGFSHADNSGYYEALNILKNFFLYFDDKKNAEQYHLLSEQLKARCNDLCWNGSFYTHFVKFNSCEIQGVDEERQLSMSNPMAINRGLTTIHQARSILEEYQKRKNQYKNYFAEWYSIDPPFPDGIFGDEKLLGGAYINGGIFPLVGGELAKAAFESGYERYGVDILLRYYQLIEQHNGSWLWYFPDGSPSTAETSTSPEATSTDGWGSTAMLHALISGLAGIEDRSKQFKNIRLAPRWLAADTEKAHVKLSYPCSEASIEYEYQSLPGSIRIKVISLDSAAVIHVLIPQKASITKVDINGESVNFTNERIGDSNYVNFTTHIIQSTSIEVYFNHEKN